MNTESKKVLPQLSIIFIVLAIAAVVVGGKSGNSVTVDLRLLASAIDSEDDHLTPDELRAMLTSGGGIQVIDLRDTAAFSASHIPGARLSTVEGVLDISPVKGVTLVLYSDGGIHAAQAWMLLKAKGVENVYTLVGGWKSWTATDSSLAAKNKSAAPDLKKVPKPPKVSKEREKFYGEC